MITLGLTHIEVGVASEVGVMPAVMNKIGRTYEDTCKFTQEASEIMEHREEGKAVPVVRTKNKKIPVLTFSIMDPDVQTLIDYVGGSDVGTAGQVKWGFNGEEVIPNKAIRLKTKQGLWFDIPNGDLEATIDADMSDKGLFMLVFTVTPMAVDSPNKAIYAYEGSSVALEVTPEFLTFTSAADSAGKDIVASSSGNVTYAAAPAGMEWLTVTRSAKTVKVKVSANTNSEARNTVVTIMADGVTVAVPVTQAGA